MKDVDCFIVEDEKVQVIVIKKVPYSISDREAIGIAIDLLKEEK